MKKWLIVSLFCLSACTSTEIDIPVENFSEAPFLEAANSSLELSQRELLLSLLAENPAAEKLLAVPFICQNPWQNEEGWTDHDESCEEAALLQAHLYLNEQTMTVPEAHETILAMIAWQEENFGGHFDISDDRLVELAQKFWNYDEDEILFFPDADEKFIKQVLSLGLPVVIPTTAKTLENPYYHHPGFHMLTAIGYTENEVICNDVGTKRGEKFAYPWRRFMQANAEGGGGALLIFPKE